jgi:hypothetical protein
MVTCVRLAPGHVPAPSTVAIATHDWTGSGWLPWHVPAVVTDSLSPSDIHRPFGSATIMITTLFFRIHQNAKRRATIGISKKNQSILLYQCYNKQSRYGISINTAFYNKYQRHNQRASRDIDRV